MSKVPKKVVNWLYTVIQPQYLYKDIVYADTFKFLDVYMRLGFKIRTSVFVSSNGNSELLLCATGSLECNGGPVHITVWIPLNYPFTEPDFMRTDANGAPLVFVNPPKDLGLSPGNYIDAQGRFYHPYLSQWFSAERSSSFSSKFNLLYLIDYVKNSFNREFPMRKYSTGPKVPPYSIPENSTLNMPRRETTGPPIPVKAGNLQDENLIPAKYRSPPPLPNQQPQQLPQNSLSTRHTDISINKGGQFKADNKITEGQVHNLVGGSKELTRNKVSSLSSQLAHANVECLMDEMTLESRKEVVDEHHQKLLSDQIEEVINGDQPGSINQMIRHVSKILKDIEPLGYHLDHQNTQAKANSDNLEKHIEYLKKKVHEIKVLNTDLVSLKDLNQSTDEEVHLSSKKRIAMDDIIVPDLALVFQLYETISEIRATEDCIKLIEGSYRNEPELINDDTLDTCMKSVRSMSRDMFWLEVTKSQIVQKMGLQC